MRSAGGGPGWFLAVTWRAHKLIILLVDHCTAAEGLCSKEEPTGGVIPLSTGWGARDMRCQETSYCESGVHAWQVQGRKKLFPSWPPPSLLSPSVPSGLVSLSSLPSQIDNKHVFCGSVQGEVVQPGSEASTVEGAGAVGLAPAVVWEDLSHSPASVIRRAS